MKKLMHLLFLSCYKATELMEKRFHLNLSRKEKIQLRLHKMMCTACANYEKESILIEKGISKMGNSPMSTSEVEALKKKISDKLDQYHAS